jgi:hypothetical protein
MILNEFAPTGLLENPVFFPFESVFFQKTNIFPTKARNDKQILLKVSGKMQVVLFHSIYSGHRKLKPSHHWTNSM